MLDIIKIALICGGIAGVGVLKWYYPGYKDDNAVEEVMESVLENSIGAKVDLTPLSPEEDKPIKKRVRFKE